MTDRDSVRRKRDRHTIARSTPPCAICGIPIDYSLPYPDPMSFVVDHVIPIALGGPDVLANKQPAHHTCNRAKAARLIAPSIRRSGSLRRGGAR